MEGISQLSQHLSEHSHPTNLSLSHSGVHHTTLFIGFHVRVNIMLPKSLGLGIKGDQCPGLSSLLQP